MQTALFSYDLPDSLIAQQPAEPRDSSRLLVLQRATGQIEHRVFRDIGEYLHPADLLVANNSRVIPARLHTRKTTGGAVEIFLLRQMDEAGIEWQCLLRGKKLVEGVKLELDSLSATVTAVHPTGTRTVRFSQPIRPYLDELGQVPLPPYITQFHGDAERYQTVYSRPEGSVAAPTAGLHFTPELMLKLREQGVGFETVTLHVGLDTFKPVEAECVEDHVIHREWAELSVQSAQRINQTSLQRCRIVAVGTTSVRTLEAAATADKETRRGGEGEKDSLSLSPPLPLSPSASCPWQRVSAFAGDVQLFIYPGYQFQAVDALITNFHLPRSSLLLLVSAFIGQAHPDDLDAGRRILLETYEVAKREGYRFFSFGDAMLIV